MSHAPPGRELPEGSGDDAHVPANAVLTVSRFAPDFRENIWVGNGPCPPRMSLIPACHSTFLTYVRISSLGGIGQDAVFAWDLPDNPQNVYSFFRDMGADAETMAYLERHSTALLQRKRTIYLPYTHGDVFSKTLELMRYPDRLRGLFVQFFGHRNVVPCSRCEKTYTTTRVTVVARQTMLVMVPFLECLSLVVGDDVFSAGRCGNCLHKDCPHDCNYSLEDWPQNAVTRALMATDNDSDDGEPITVGDQYLCHRPRRTLHPTTAPIQASLDTERFVRRVETSRNTQEAWQKEGRLGRTN